MTEEIRDQLHRLAEVTEDQWPPILDQIALGADDLLPFTSDADGSVALGAAIAIVRRGAWETAKAIYCQTDREWLKEFLVNQAVDQPGRDAHPARLWLIERVLDFPNRQLRIGALYAAWRIGPAAAINIIVRCLKDRSPSVHIAAIQLIAELKDPPQEVIDILTEHLTGHDLTRAAYAAHALRKMGRKDIIDLARMLGQYK